MAKTRTWFLYQYLSITIVLSANNLFTKYVDAQTPSMSSHSEGGDDICAENPPHCDVKQRSVNGTSGTFSTPFHTGIDIIVIQMNITSTSPTVCAIDPLVLAAQVLDYEVTDVTQLTLLINCARSDTRIVIRPVNNLTFPLILGFVHISNCVLYWKDLSKLGNFLSI